MADSIEERAAIMNEDPAGRRFNSKQPGSEPRGPALHSQP